MSTCDQMDDFVAGLLAGEQRAAFEAHLAVCESCATELAELRLVDREVGACLARQETPAVTVRAARQLERRARAQYTGRERGNRRLWLVLAGAGTVVWRCLCWHRFWGS